MRLIDADALIAKFKDDLENLQEFAFRLATIGAINTVKHQPTIDAVPVIRCKDCKKRKQCKVATEYYYCDMTGAIVGVSEFCSWAERKEE